MGRSLFRVNRDTRFATDKTPYKTHVDFVFWTGDGPPRSRPAFIMRITSAAVLIGAGRIGLSGPSLDAFRSALTDPARGTSIRTTVDDLLATGARLSEANRARPPRPHEPGHANADLLRRDGFHLTRTTPHPQELATAAFADWCTRSLTPFAPLIAWFESIDD